MNPYTELDAAIVARVKELGKASFMWLYSDEVRRAAEEAERAGVAVEAYRIVDRRLQALKRAGVIRFQRGPNAGWVLA